MQPLRVLHGAAALALIFGLAACGGGKSDSDSSTPSPFSQADFNKAFNQYIAAEPSHFQDLVGEQVGKEGIVGIFNSKLDLPGTNYCHIKNTADDKANVQCSMGEFASLDEAKKLYATLKERALKALPADAKTTEPAGSDDVPAVFVMLVKGGMAEVAVAKDDDTKKYEVGYVFAKPS